ncbi:MAG: hypothetical protein WCJ88_06795 [Actinomycetes bacterium]
MSETNESSSSKKAATCCDGGLCRDDWHRHPIRLTEFLLVALVIQVMDILLTMRVEIIGENLRTTEKVLKIVGDSSDVLFVVVLIALVIAMVHHRLTVARESNSRVILFILVAYLAIASLNVGVNMITLVVVQNLSNVSQNGLIIDLGFLFASNMLLFSLWYQLADAYLKGGAFDFSPNEAHPDDPPKWVDYLFLSFNTQATFGPTLEGLRTRPAKVIMMLQTSLSLIVLIVLVARIITAPN